MFSGHELQVAVYTSLICIIFAGSTSSYLHYKNNLINIESSDNHCNNLNFGSTGSKHCRGCSRRQMSAPIQKAHRHPPSASRLGCQTTRRRKYVYSLDRGRLRRRGAAPRGQARQLRRRLHTLLDHVHVQAVIERGFAKLDLLRKRQSFALWASPAHEHILSQCRIKINDLCTIKTRAFTAI